MKVNLSDYSGSVSAGNWTPAVIAAWNDIKANGGEIYLDDQTITVNGPTSIMAPESGVQVPLLIRGDGSSRVLVDAGSYAVGLYSGNLASLAFRDFAMHGVEGSSTHDCLNAINSAYTFITTIENMIFAGVSSLAGTVQCGAAASLSVKGCKFGGNTGPADIILDGGSRLSVDNCDFLDYEVLANVYYSKTPSGMNAWIKAINPLTSDGATFPPISIKKCRFDEGATHAIDIDGYPSVDIEGCSINVNSSSLGIGIVLNDVKNARIVGCNAGYTTQDRLAVSITGNSNVLIDGLTVQHGVYRVATDATARLTIKNSPGVTVTAAAGATYSVDGVTYKGSVTQIGN